MECSLMLFALLFHAAVSAAPPSTADPERSKPVLGMMDYPPEALRNHRQGSVVAELTVSPQGRATECRIVRSSGHKVLDDATCDLMIQRARFSPARDSQGN